MEHLKTLIADGYVGRVRSTSLIGSGGNWANTTSAALYYLFDKANGGTMEDIPMGHTLAAVRDVLRGCNFPDGKYRQTGPPAVWRRLDRALAAFEKVGNKLGILKGKAA